MMRLTNTMTLRLNEERERSNSKTSRKAISTERDAAKRGYITYTDFSKDQQKNAVLMDTAARRPNWKHDYYKVNNTFSIFPKK